MKLAICMGYWDGDKDQAQQASMLLADLLPTKSSIAQFAFIYRHDASPPDTHVLHHIARKFTSVRTQRCPVVGFGHPGGCNAIAFSAFRLMANDAAFDQAESFLLMESDCVMTRPKWDVELWHEWERTKAAGKLACGHVYPGSYQNPSGFHLNASALYDSKIASKVPQIGRGNMAVGHDWANGPYNYPVCMDSPLFWLDYRKPTITRQELFAPQKGGVPPLMFHGTRDNSAIRLVREEYKL